MYSCSSNLYPIKRMWQSEFPAVDVFHAKFGKGQMKGILKLSPLKLHPKFGLFKRRLIHHWIYSFF